MLITLIYHSFLYPPILCVAYLSEVLEVVLLSFQKKFTTVAYKRVAYKKNVYTFMHITLHILSLKFKIGMEFTKKKQHVRLTVK